MDSRAMGIGGCAIAAVMGVVSVPSRAEACGGCFAPTGTVTVVTAHRMAVSLSPTETTLWDQIEYAGSPEDFVWVLPIQGETLVELADDAFFGALGEATRVTLEGAFAPLRTWCPDPCPSDWSAGAQDASAAWASDGGTDAGPSSPPVTVYGEAVVGPYETATIGSTDPDALVTWLRDHDYAVPDSILPVITHYTDLGLNFAVLRLNPNAGVNQMRPVRITTPGLMPVFPLRMIAAGASGSVALELYVFAEGRSGSQNFEVREIPTSGLYWDWATRTFNYDQLFATQLAYHDGRAWVAEYARPADDWTWRVREYTSYDEDRTRHTAEADLSIATRSIEAPYLTKLRADMPVAHLDEDLILEASLGADIDDFRLVTNERNRPPTPVCPTTCDRPPPDSDAPMGAGTLEPGASTPAGGGGLCSAVPSAAPGTAAWLLTACALLTIRRHRR